MKHVSMNFREFRRDESTSLSSLNKGLFRSILNRNLSSVSAIISSVHLDSSMEDGYIYRGRGGGWDPYYGGREGLSHGRFPQKVETRGQRRKVVVIQSNHSL